MNLNSIFSYSVKSNPDKKALINSADNSSLTYQELYIQIKEYSSFFYSNGIRGNIKVAMKLKNSFDWIIIFYSLLYLGAIPVLIDFNFTGRELDECLNASGADILITEDHDRILKLDSLISSGNVRKLFILSDKIVNASERIISVNKRNVHESGANLALKNSKGYSHVVLFSYRGIGYPLAVNLSENAIVKSVLNNIYLTKVDSSLCISMLLPASHIFSLTTNLLVPLSVGASIVLINNLMPKSVFEAIETYRINFIIAVPTLIKVLLYSLLKSGYKNNYLKQGIVGGNTFSPELFHDWFENTRCDLLHGYGLTETCPVICNGWDSNEPDSIGNAMFGVEAVILDKKNKEVPINAEGTLLIKSRTNMEEYINSDILKENCLTDGWIDTGDIACKDNKGFYHFLRRDKKIAKIGGQSVDLVEIENILKKHPDITEVKISIGKDKLWDEKIECTIKATGELSRNAVLEYLKDNLASYKIPKEIKIIN
jgi:acyl-CoA synthetase (AMP-forming)/AMP-acid ligase II